MLYLVDISEQCGYSLVTFSTGEGGAGEAERGGDERRAGGILGHGWWWGGGGHQQAVRLQVRTTGGPLPQVSVCGHVGLMGEEGVLWAFLASRRGVRRSWGMA